MGEEIHEIAEGYEREVAVHESLNSGPVANSSLVHLTLSDKAMEFLEKNDITRSLVPLADQICATNKLDDRGIALNKAMVDSAILHIKIFGDEDDQTGHGDLRTARIYLHQLIEGCKNGYRGALATESRRLIRTRSESSSEEKRGWRR